MLADKSPKTFCRAWKDRLNTLRNIPPLLLMVWQSGPKIVGAIVSLRILAALIPVAMLAVTRLIVDNVMAVASHHQPLQTTLWSLVAFEFFLAGLSSILSRLIDYFDTLFADRYTLFISARVMEHASSLDLATYENPTFYDRLERARVQATDRLNMIQAMGQILQQLILASTFSISIFMFSPWLLLILIACVMPSFLGESHFSFLGYSLCLQQTPVRRQLDYLRALSASKEAAKELKLFGLSRFFTGLFRQLSLGIYQQNVALAKRRLFAGSLLSLLSTAGYYGSFVFVVYQTASGKLTVGMLTFLAGAIAGACNGIQSIFSLFSTIADQSLFLTDLLEFFRLRPQVQSKPETLPAPRPIQQGFQFVNVSFSYPGSSRLILDKLNLRLEPGERLALIGENGQGKTTIVKLLTRLYDPTEGCILLDGVDLREYSIEDLCSQIGVIFQDFMRYEMNASSNIAVGKIEELSNPFKIEVAALKSHAHTIIQKLPLGYGQMLGRRFEGGVDLSGGEWQKLALARAYMRDAQLIILDEPTASLDARSEYEVFQSFAELTDSKMALLISHRFSTVRMSDRILVLEKGRIAEQGSHRQLMALGGLYSGMFELQAACYR